MQETLISLHGSLMCILKGCDKKNVATDRRSGSLSLRQSSGGRLWTMIEPVSRSFPWVKERFPKNSRYGFGMYFKSFRETH
jgi:hypothetical protein